MWFIDVEVEQETSAPPPKKNPGSAPAFLFRLVFVQRTKSFYSDCGFLCSFPPGLLFIMWLCLSDFINALDYVYHFSRR